MTPPKTLSPNAGAPASAFQLDRPLDPAAMDAQARALVALLATGGDARITLDPASGLNRYLSGPYPRDVLAYSSSTISDISPGAFAHLLGEVDAIKARPYEAVLDGLRERIMAALGLGEGAGGIVFAPSGTDLEYVALACVLGKGAKGARNILLGADETGSGCIHSAHGRFFAHETALGVATLPGASVPGCGPVDLTDVPVRGADGAARTSASVTAAMAREIAAAQARGCHALVHCVHGSKTGLVLPALADIDALQARFGSALTFVVDACQARITNAAIADYLARGCIVLMTGSKFAGAPPFNGWALVPPALAQGAAPLPGGFAQIFRRAEWPAHWPGREALEDSANPSLALRLTAALFELERFQALEMARVVTLIERFHTALETHLVAPLGLVRVMPAAGPQASEVPIEMRTLVTLDLTALAGLETFEQAQDLHRALALDGIRLGQPVKCVPRQGGWGASMRVGLAMPQMIRWAAMCDADVTAELTRDMQRIAEALTKRLDRSR